MRLAIPVALVGVVGLAVAGRVAETPSTARAGPSPWEIAVAARSSTLIASAGQPSDPMVNRFTLDDVLRGWSIATGPEPPRRGRRLGALGNLHMDPYER